MTIHLTQDEALAYLKDYLASKGMRGTVEIENVAPSGGMNYVEAVVRVTRYEFRLQGTGNENKIKAIKRLRELVTGLGLGEAKVAIEQPDAAILHYVKTKEPMRYTPPS